MEEFYTPEVEVINSPLVVEEPIVSSASEVEEEDHVDLEKTKQLVYDAIFTELKFPQGFDKEDMILFIRDVEFPQETDDESIEEYKQECLNIIKEKMFPSQEQNEEEDTLELTPDFIADRLSDLQSVEGDSLSFAFTTFSVSEADIANVSALSSYQTLRYIKLESNLISDISPLTNISGLRELYLAGNKITSFDNISFPCLEILDLRQNQIKTIEKLLIPKLKKLFLSQNKICFISPNAFSDLNELNELDLTENKLHKFKENTFLGLNKIETFNLSQNLIEECDFGEIHTLKSLSIGGNSFDTINGIRSLKSLEKLDLQMSSIANINDLKDLSELKHLESIALDGSPVCDVEAFRIEIILLVPSIEEINGEEVNDAERQEAEEMEAERKRKEAEESEINNSTENADDENNTVSDSAYESH
ncbi:leucine-rich repeat-containing protein 23 [Histomonas meleagridis]|uniref:leucine-rich repeat-containing protein 23 n=1 Tax=Histomonas meleagridis TaxID=135588 RepID=UPI00355A692D|nr:leucine-rich repeat-containing protein 23 [Histomonas meleagridis]KAH0804816.1 leucine-rich repeat-containing protein 23 [Histomonas meleagridis]